MKKIMVTGASGFVGSFLTEYLLKEGYGVKAFDLQPFPLADKTEGLEQIVGDLEDLSDIKATVQGCSGVIHLGAISRVSICREQPERCIAVNLMGSVNVLEAIRLEETKPWMIFGSTREVKSNLSDGETFSQLYGISKLSSELIAKRYAVDYGLKILALRFSDIYGSVRGNLDKVLSLFVRKALEDEILTINNISCFFDFIHFQDLVSGIVKSMNFLEGLPQTDTGFYDSLPLCTGRTLNLQDLAEIIVKELGADSEIKVTASAPLKGSVDLENDPLKAGKLIGFTSTISLEKGIKEFAQAMKRSNPIYLS